MKLLPNFKNLKSNFETTRELSFNVGLRSALVGYQFARSAHFASQQLSLPFFETLATGEKRKAPKGIAELRQDLIQELRGLLQTDSDNILQGVYPLEVLRPESPTKHFLRFGRILYDGVALSKRRMAKTSKEFDEEAQSYLDEVPEYYKRNYHFQTGGYLNSHSASLYEHQVEILFAGGADAMRRLILAPLKERLPGDGEGLRFLEVGAGTGRLTRFMKLAYPKARIVATDLSWPYLKAAQKNLEEFDRIDFVQAPGEKLPFEGEQFDLVYSCFLFHEVPQEVRSQIFAEGHRVLKPGGLYGLVDSLQKGNDSRFDGALERFPRDFHEPFFKNYLHNSLENILTETGFENVAHNQAFLSKALVATKIDSSKKH